MQKHVMHAVGRAVQQQEDWPRVEFDDAPHSRSATVPFFLTGSTATRARAKAWMCTPAAKPAIG
eukprot:3386479-Prymnesium_polylepis.1